MAIAIGQVREVNGSYFIKSPDGTIKELKVGDTIFEGDIVYGEQGNTDYENIYVTLEKDQTDILLTGDESQLFDASMMITASEGESETKSVLLSETSDDENSIDETETAAGEEAQVPDSSGITTTLFAQHEENRVNVTTDSPEASDGSIIDRGTAEVDASKSPIEAATHQAYAESAYAIDDTSTQKSVHADVIEALQEVQDAADAANIAAQEAQKIALSAEDASAAALSDPSVENIAAAEAGAVEAITAAQKADDAALAAKEAVQQIETPSDTAEEELTLAVSNAHDAAQSAENASIDATNAATESEAVTDAIMETANTAAAAADDVTDASQAAADIQEAAAQSAYEAAGTQQNIAEATRDAAQIAKDAISDLDDTTLTDAEAKGEVALDAADAYITEALTAQTAANAYLSAAIQAQTDAKSSHVSAQDAYDKALAANEDSTDEAAALDAATIAIDAADAEVVTARTVVETANTEVVNADALKAEITVLDTAIEAKTDAIVDEAYETAQDAADLAQAAADTAEAKAAAADEAKSAADSDPSVADLEAAESAQQEAIDAASAATAASETAQGVLDTYTAMAASTDETLADSTAIEAAIINANNAANTAMTAAAESETVTDAEIATKISDLEQLMTTAYDAATAADDAATSADAAVTLANGDPTPDNLAAAQTAQAAAILAATTAADAASSTDEAASRLEAAAIAANETIPSIITTAHDVADTTDTAASTANAIGNVNLHISAVSDSSVIENTVDENSANGSEVGITAHAADLDGQAVTYSIIDSDGQKITDGPFAVDADSGVVTVRDGSQLDFESATAHDIIIQSNSEDGSSSSQTFTVDVQNINEGPIALTDGTDVLGDETAGAAAGVTVTGIYRNGSSENILEGVDDELVTSTTHDYFDHGAFGETGYNYMGDHHWFNDHDISLGDTKGGVITFSDGTMGVIDNVSNGYGASESAYVYYNAADGIEIGQAYYETTEDRALQIDVLANDSDIDSDTLTLMDVENPVTDAEGIAIGTTVISGDKILFTPNAEMDRLGAGESEDVTFTYSVSDGESVDSATVHINVIGTNDGPVLGDAITFENIDEDNVLHFTEADLLTNASDVDGDTLSVNTLHSENGTITDLGDGNYLFSPDADYHGDANITFNVNDGHTDVSSSASFTIDAINDGPVAIDDDTFRELPIVEAKSSGMDDGDWGEQQRGVTIDGEHVGGNTRGLTVTVLDEDNGLLSTETFDTYGDASASALLVDHITDLQNSELSSKIIITTSDEWTRSLSDDAKEVLVDIGADAATLAAPEIRSSFVLVTAQEGDSWQVEYQDYAPRHSENGSSTTLDGTLSTKEDTAITIDVLANDSDVDGEILTLVSVQDSDHGNVEIIDGKILFTPDANYHGPATFTYTVSDGAGGEDTATVTLDVDSVNDVVTQVTDIDATANNIDENVADGTYTGVMLDATDGDGDAISYSVEDGVPFKVKADGSVVVDGDDTIDFETTPNYTFDVTATSADGTSSIQSVNVNINDINDAPTAREDTLQAIEDTTLTISIDDLLSNDSDVDGDTFSLTEVAATENTHGTVEIVNKVAFEDDFNDDTTDGWSEISFNGADLGNWESSDGKIGQQSNSAKGIFAHEMGRDASSTDYSISVDVDANIGATGNNGVGLVFGYIDAENYFQVSWDDYSTNYDTSTNHKDFNLIQMTDGTKTVLDTVNRAELPNNFDLDVSVDENGITVIVDGIEMLASTEQPALETIGLWTSDNDGGSSYDNIVVKADSAGKEIEFTPEADHSGEASFEYTITDADGATDTATVDLHVNEAPEAPVIETITDTTGELDMMVSGTAAANIEIRLYDEATLVGTTTSDENGDWSISGDDVIDEMLEGPVSLKAMSVEGGFSSPVSNIVNATIHTDARDTDSSIRSANESIFGGAGDDKLYAGEESDILDGGTGKDIIDFVRSSEGVSVDLRTNEVSGGNAEGDTISNFESVYGSNYNDTITGTDEANTIYTRAGDDVIDGGAGDDYLIGGAGADIIDGGEGSDTASYSGEAIDVDLTTGEGYGGDAEGDTLIDIENISGGDGDDTLIGDDANNILSGRDGDDTLHGAEGNDTLIGGDGDDTIDGGEGSDRILAGEGDDTITFDADDTVDGGLGFDTLMMSDEIQIDFGAISDNISNIEQLDLGQGSQSVQQLNIEDVLEITPTDDHTLRISGDLGDEVQLNHTDDDSAAEWTKAAESLEGEDGHTYDIYTGISGDETVTLQIDQSVTVTDF